MWSISSICKRTATFINPRKEVEHFTRTARKSQSNRCSSQLWKECFGLHSRQVKRRSACDRDYRQEVVTFDETFLFKILAPEHRGLSSGKSFNLGHTAWDKGIRLGRSETNPEHIAGTKNGAVGTGTIRRLELAKRSETSVLLETTRKALRHGSPAPPCHQYTKPPDRWQNRSSSSDSSSSSSSSTHAPSRIPQHAKDRAQTTTEVSRRLWWV